MAERKEKRKRHVLDVDLNELSDLLKRHYDLCESYIANGDVEIERVVDSAENITTLWIKLSALMLHPSVINHQQVYLYDVRAKRKLEIASLMRELTHIAPKSLKLYIDED